MAKRTLVNFQQIRADKSVGAPTVTDMDGVEHVVGVFPLDFFMEVLELQDSFGKALDGSDMARLLGRIKTMIAAVMPTFPAGRLDFTEAQMLIEALVATTQPEGAQAETPRDEAGELTPPAGSGGSSTSTQRTQPKLV